MKKFIVLSLLVGLCGCTALRVFQTKAPAPLVKAPAQVEAERASADLIARKIETPVELRPVAGKLSASLGAPLKPFELPTLAENVSAASGSLDKSMADMQHKLDQLNLKLTKLQGKEIEGTGFSLLGPGMGALVIGLIVLAVACPPALTLMMFAYRRLKATAGMVVEQIDAAAKSPETQAAVQQIKQNLNAKMDTVHKRVIHALQKP